jgi:hypothetical protein
MARVHKVAHENNKLSSSQPTIPWTFNILKVNHNHDTFRSEQTIIQWTEINTDQLQIGTCGYD